MYEFEKLIGRVEWIRRYKVGPLLEERNAFLVHLRSQGYSARQLRTNNKYVLWIAELIDVRQSAAVTPSQIECAAQKWVATHCRARFVSKHRPDSQGCIQTGRQELATFSRQMEQRSAL